MPLHLASQRIRTAMTVFVILGLALMALILATASQADAHAQPASQDLTSTFLITQTYVIFATGPSSNHQSVSLTGSYSSGDNFQIVDGGIYGGDGGHIQDMVIVGNAPPPIDIVGGCSGNCNVGGDAVVNFNAEPLPTPTLYNIADYQPGGQYAVIAGSNYHSYSGSKSFSGSMPAGLYYVDGDVVLHDVLGTATIIATGDIRILGNSRLITYDARFPLLFTTSTSSSSGAIGANNPDLEYTGDLYAPNGRISISGGVGALYGRVYGSEVALDASRMTIICSTCKLPRLALFLQKSVTPTLNVPYHGVVTYTNVLRNHDLVSDTDALFTDTLPAGVTFGQWLEQPDGVVQNGDTISWTGALSASTNITLAFSATHTGSYGDVITNTAHFSGATNSGSASAAFVLASIFHTLTIGYEGNGVGTVAANPIGTLYPAGTVITLTAAPDTTSRFISWSGDVVTTANPATLTLDADKSVTATFMLKTFVITPTTGVHGSIFPPTPQTIDYGASQAFTITPESSYHIVDVGVDGVSQGPIDVYTFDNVTADHTITATFAINTYTLMLNTAGNGSGSVAANPSDLSYSAGTVVTLTAVPSTTSRFTGWSGGVMTTTNPLVMTMDGNKTITATFVTHRVYLPLVIR